MYLPYGSVERRKEREGGDVFGLPQGPVVGGKGSSEGTLAERDDKVDQPQEGEHVEHLEEQDVAVVEVLVAVGVEEAARLCAISRQVARVERLKGDIASALLKTFGSAFFREEPSEM